MPWLTIGVVFSFAPEAAALIKDFIEALKDKPTTPPKRQLSFKGGGFMRTYKGDRPAEMIIFRKPTVVDSEGTAVDPQPELLYDFESSNPDLVGVSANDTGGPTVEVNLTYGTPIKLEDGSYDMTELKATSNDVDLGEGILVDVRAELIQLVPGDAAGFAGSGGFELPE
jgi:hypothetical protein